MKIRQFLLSLLCLVTLTAFSQTSQISGNIVDENQDPLPYANVLLLNAIDSSLYKGIAIEDGEDYLFTDVSANTYIIHCSLVGYGEIYSEPFSCDGTSPVLMPQLHLINGIEMDQVTITAKKPFIELQADKTIVNVANSIVNAGNSALEVLEKSPGVVLDNNQNILLNGKQGVLITINGKNQYISGQELVQLLESMPSSQIEKLEIITNPSAKHDASGNSGIINIVLKKNEKIGFNGRVNSTFRKGELASHFHGLSLNYRSEKLNVFGSADYADWGWNQDLNLKRTINHLEGAAFFDQSSYIFESGKELDSKIGFDYLVTPAINIGFLVKSTVANNDNGVNNTTDITGYNSSNFSQLMVNTISS